jgi:hypothetical protein
MTETTEMLIAQPIILTLESIIEKYEILSKKYENILEKYLSTFKNFKEKNDLKYNLPIKNKTILEMIHDVNNLTKWCLENCKEEWCFNTKEFSFAFIAAWKDTLINMPLYNFLGHAYQYASV